MPCCMKYGQQRLVAGRKNYIFFLCPLDGEQFILFVMFFFACRSHISNGFDADLCSLAWYEVDVTWTNVANTAGFPGALVLLNKNI